MRIKLFASMTSISGLGGAVCFLKDKLIYFLSVLGRREHHSQAPIPT